MDGIADIDKDIRHVAKSTRRTRMYQCAFCVFACEFIVFLIRFLVTDKGITMPHLAVLVGLLVCAFWCSTAVVNRYKALGLMLYHACRKIEAQGIQAQAQLDIARQRGDINSEFAALQQLESLDAELTKLYALV